MPCSIETAHAQGLVGKRGKERGRKRREERRKRGGREKRKERRRKGGSEGEGEVRHEPDS